MQSTPANAVEANFDGLVGPTHNYAGLSFGNVASHANEKRVANPKQAALQGLLKMKSLAALGYRQAVLPPHERPSVDLLRTLGFTGDDARVIRDAARSAPELLSAASSASAMWAANAATVSPSADTADGRVHVTPANLAFNLHRSIEHTTTQRVLGAILADDRHFVVHPALPGTPVLGDEGAANHTRFCGAYDTRGVEFFVYGRRVYGGGPAPVRYPARQTFEASRAIARRHGLADDAVVYAQQRPDVIDAGVFHNDVIAVGNQRVLFCHAHAFVDQHAVYDALRERLARTGATLDVVEVPDDDVSVADAVGAYLFNSQLLALGDGRQRLIVPQECRENARVAAYLDRLVAAGGPIADYRVFDLRESMRNGGGPACLRLRVALNAAEAAAVKPSVWIDDARYDALTRWVETHYRDRLAFDDLADPHLLDETRTALDALTRLLDLGSIYAFQR
ncbi:N-succinylarginine dihydrolase [Pararobbsia silviterrae]|uniref:N-succinylarginine dihydrolase n=1 Tax=Pararobbsia silviterrae TaxID=1792498 RepID=A0A494XHX9_9BURK|nr:N-succinylarginine dihydrolase [Pararobbsia silviterrae]RKP50365.1 N-succinylarginine dihydrolase [Pararobbsia silviterrae]